LVQAITLIFIGTPFTLAWGANGTLVAVAITMLLAFGLSLRYTFAQVALSWREVFGTHLVAAAVTVIALTLIQQWSEWNSLSALIRLIMVGIISFGVFAGMLYLLKPAEIIERIRYVRHTFPAKHLKENL
jgi:ABC-type glycerol-3-phosphate transport system permease component